MNKALGQSCNCTLLVVIFAVPPPLYGASRLRSGPLETGREGENCSQVPVQSSFWKDTCFQKHVRKARWVDKNEEEVEEAKK